MERQVINNNQLLNMERPEQLKCDTVLNGIVTCSRSCRGNKSYCKTLYCGKHTRPLFEEHNSID